jgi:quercetin dioxygenase-like cupin family protein
MVTTKTLQLMGGTAAVKAASTDTDGAFTMLEFVALPDAYAEPLHIHSREDECLYLLEGSLLVTVGQVERPLEAGEFVFMPRGEVHGWRNPGPDSARFLTVFVPGGGERYMQDLAAVLAAGAPASPETVAKLMVHHGIRRARPGHPRVVSMRPTVS